MRKRYLSIVCLLGLSGCKFSFDSSPTPPPVIPPPAPNPLAGCWDPGVKQNLAQLAQSISSDSFNKSLPNDMSQQDTSAVEKSFNLTTTNFMTFSYDKDSGSLKCGASFSYTYTRPDGSTEHHDKGDILSFEVYQGESGLEPLMSGADMPTIQIQYQAADGSGNNGNPLSSGTQQ